jgi:hypothetical protein
MENGLKYKSEIFSEGKHFGNEYYSFAFSERVINIRLERQAVTGDDMECSFLINPDGHVRLELFSGENSLRVRLIDNLLEVYFNGNFKEAFEIHKEEAVLLDGPSPIFDYMNYIYFVHTENEEVTRNVFQLDFISGTLIKKKYSFLKRGNQLKIDKNDCKAEIETGDDYRMMTYKKEDTLFVFEY